VRLAIADGTVGLCPLVADGTGVGEPTLAVIRESCLLEALTALFERYWDLSFPVRINESDPAGSPAESDDRHLLSLLVAGVADKAIATQFGVSLRTVQRRVRELMCRLNAQTRMQLAWEASRRGWLEELHDACSPQD
jgi:DNA-binding NarL/FixJ family response regulator